MLSLLLLQSSTIIVDAGICCGKVELSSDTHNYEIESPMSGNKMHDVEKSDVPFADSQCILFDDGDTKLKLLAHKKQMKNTLVFAKVTDYAKSVDAFIDLSHIVNNSMSPQSIYIHMERLFLISELAQMRQPFEIQLFINGESSQNFLVFQNAFYKIRSNTLNESKAINQSKSAEIQRGKDEGGIHGRNGVEYRIDYASKQIVYHVSAKEDVRTLQYRLQINIDYIPLVHVFKSWELIPSSHSSEHDVNIAFKMQYLSEIASSLARKVGKRQMSEYEIEFGFVDSYYEMTLSESVRLHQTWHKGNDKAVRPILDNGSVEPSEDDDESRFIDWEQL